MPFFISKFLNVYIEGVIPALDAGIQPFCNLIENVVPPFYASLLVSNLDPSTGMTKKGYLNDILEFTL
ncbi:hypothetical protein [Wolbachia endosymbiont (group B) of Episyrphus balteatus]|uniref:hypothetical protein n=1 Tax=Wolbachia endosymbiont (group B) of Episyrphus balteatus TaxID=2954009 RepID=UPI000AB10A6F|nr:hypothetical protein [Wolbachia endosymbiont (group B) of Episyrphus balteatus]